MEGNSDATILVVDDNPAGRYATSRILRAGGFTVIEAATGKDALASLKGVDLVVLDVNLPDIDGFEVCRRIRSTAELSRLPVIHLSATFVKDTDKVQGLDAGADGYLTHPVEPPVLIATINAFLRTRRAEHEMRTSEAKFKAIFDQALSGILLVTQDLVCLEANPAMCALIARRREEIVGRHTSSFVPAGHEPDMIAIARQVEERGAWRGTFPLIRVDGSHVELEWSIARHSVPGVRLAIVNDVTERKIHERERERLLAAEKLAREEAEHANRLKDEFLAILSHELRTPLNAIVGWSQILKHGKPSAADIAQGIEAIERNAHSQSQLISDLLDVSRITSGKLRLDIRTIDAAAVIRNALETIAPAAQAKNIRLQSDLDGNASTIQADSERIQQVVWNLVNNAVKFTPRGGTIWVKLARDKSDSVITVSDNGQGIKSDFLPHIFERFRQENATTRRSQGGLGLGLAIVKHLVEMHGGTVSAQNGGQGGGATFIVRLPILEMQPDDPAVDISNDTAVSRVARAAAITDTAALRDIKILVVEDDADARILLRAVLARVGANVAEAVSVEQALSALTTSVPDIIISDVGLPDQDGFDLIQLIRANEKWQELPVIALTAFASNHDREQLLQAGFQLHLSKPADANELIAAVSSLVHDGAAKSEKRPPKV